MLATLRVERRPGVFAFITLPPATVAPEAVAPLIADAHAVIEEDEGTTVVIEADRARAGGHTVDFEAAWLTLAVHSALEAIGLTAAVSAALAEAGIPCNMIAGYHHDHLLVPTARADDAAELLTTRWR